MKIEVCEQMLAAWLNHIKGCQLVQTNWIPSPVAVENLSEETLTSIGEFVSAINRFSEENNLDIFKHSTVKQMVGQCEIDIVGVRLEDGIVQKVYLIDSAFHENGLNYGDVVARVLKKILRAIFVADASFRNIPAQIVFVSPKCGENLRQILQEHVQFLRETVKRFYPDSEILVLFNEDFTQTVYEPLLEKVDSLNDDNDLFLRSVKLCKTAESFKGKTFPQQYSEKPPRAETAARKTPRGGNREIVFGILHRLIDRGLMTEELVSELCRPGFAKRNFSLPSFPVLIRENELRRLGYEECRFYKNDPIEILNTQYLVCSQWIPERIRRLQSWYERLPNE